MEFYNRSDELKLLAQLEEDSKSTAHMTILTGRRRIGKTQLLFEAYQNSCWVYLFVARKSEPLLCEEFVREIETSLHIKILGEFKDFVALFEYLMEYATKTPLTLVIDEFQEFYQVNPSVYS